MSSNFNQPRSHHQAVNIPAHLLPQAFIDIQQEQQQQTPQQTQQPRPPPQPRSRSQDPRYKQQGPSNQQQNQQPIQHQQYQNQPPNQHPQSHQPIQHQQSQQSIQSYQSHQSSQLPDPHQQQNRLQQEAPPIPQHHQQPPQQVTRQQQQAPKPYPRQQLPKQDSHSSIQRVPSGPVYPVSEFPPQAQNHNGEQPAPFMNPRYYKADGSTSSLTYEQQPIQQGYARGVPESTMDPRYQNQNKGQIPNPPYPVGKSLTSNSINSGVGSINSNSINSNTASYPQPSNNINSYGSGPGTGSVIVPGSIPSSVSGSNPGSVPSPPVPGAGFGIEQQQSSPSQPQHRRPLRKAPSSNLPPIMSDGGGARRIVSSPNMPQYSSFSTPSQQQSGSESRTKSLSSSSLKYGQMPRQNNSQQQQPQGSTVHRPLSSSGGSSSSLHHTFSLSNKSRSFTSISKLSSLSTKKFNSSSSLTNSNIANNKLDRTSTGASSKTAVMQPLPYNSSVYPALLSEVAKVFKEVIILTINTKDGLEYHDTFTGKMSVDIICRIIRTSDRNLALLLGRSLDAQKFFHDVTYNHRLRDSVHEVYAFSHIYSDVEFYHDEGNSNSANNSKHGSFVVDNNHQLQHGLSDQAFHLQQPSISPLMPSSDVLKESTSLVKSNSIAKEASASQQTGVNGVFTILTDCYSPTCTRNRLCYSIACPRRLEQQARLNMKPQGGLKRAVSRLSLHEKEETKTLWHETVPQSILDKLDKQEKMRQELIYEFIYTERDYVKDLEFMTDFYIMPLRNPANNIIPENQRETFIHTVFGGVGDLLRLAKNMSEALTRRQQQQKPVVETLGDVFLDYVGNFEPFIRYSGNKVFASFEHERQQQVNMRYARFLDAIEKKPESRKQDLSSFLIKGVQRPARYQLLLGGILKNTKPESPDYKNLVKAKEEIERVLGKINIQTGESTDRHKIMVLHRLLGKQTLETKYNFKLSYNHRIIYQVTLSRKRDNEKIDLYLFEHALLLVKHKIQNKREQHKVFEKPLYLPLLYANSGYDVPTIRSVISHRYRGSVISDTGLKNRAESTTYIGTTLNSNSTNKFQLNILGLGSNQVHATLFADELSVQNQVLQQIYNQQKKLIEENDLFSLSKYETRRFHGNNKINCAVPCYGGKKLLYGTDSGVWVSTVRSISATSNEKICSDPTLVISKMYVTQIEVVVEYSKILILSDKTLYEFDLSCTDSLDHQKNTKSGKMILNHVSFFKIGICDGRLLVCAAKTGSTHSISIFEPANPFDKNNQRNKNKKYDIQEVTFSSDPISISFLKTMLCVGCTKGFESLSLEKGMKESILDEADPSLDFAIQRETVTPLAIHRLGRSDFLLCYAEFVFLINKNGWRTNHYWDIYWEGNPQNVALFFPYLLSFEPGFIEIRDLNSTKLLRALVGDNIRFLHSNEHEALYACSENGYDIIVSIDFLNLKPRTA